MANNPPLPDPLVVRLARENRRALLAREDLQVQRMAKQWLQIERSLQRDMLILAQEIADAKAAGKVITEQLIARMDRYKTLNASLKQQVLNYSKNQAAKDITAEQLLYAKHGIDGAVAAIKSQFNLGISFNTLSVDQVTDLAGLLGDGTPLNRLLKEAYPESLDGIVKALLEGSTRGLGINQIAADMAKRMGMGLERITLIARTEQLRAWRIATQRQYQESGVVLWHERLCARDARTCMACLALDGEKIPVDQVLDDHPRGRCTTIPIVKGAPPIVREMGQEWFERQSPATQKDMLGSGMYDLWQGQGFELKKIAGKNYDPIWGSSPRVRTLEEMLGSR
jgi:SPP1 gp7 family putative phage head morphogenesis protein